MHEVAPGTKFQIHLGRESANRSQTTRRRDLFHAIEKVRLPVVDCPEFQNCDVRRAEELWEKQRINVFDDAPSGPTSNSLSREVGVFRLNGNAKNYFAEIEQELHSTQHIASGIPNHPPTLSSRRKSLLIAQMLTVTS